MAPPSPLFPDPFPAPWADEWFEDEYGLGMVLALGEARQCFRWIPPGRFLMGSPEDEPERFDNETQHVVILSRGYWLADTSCTQNLWQAVVGSNNSRFRNDFTKPVERVSWEEVKTFISKLNQIVPNLVARLPTESEWEYACRAGTSTSFTFGNNITPEEVNYNGKFPYAGGGEGMFRDKTVPVKSLPPNIWGLYEMHGNIWEWCADWYSNYPNGEIIDPFGPPQGTHRTLRGGSWIDDGGHARSACRGKNLPGDHSDLIGFRLALG
ncbi:Formylglycine-generating enzyme, required for sulfatase activity, contains SUMF1/FGE domain [Methylomagnum ishizawai]|uniref:Formylglycine-generating enzyme, required for sulfatase activity, contains SUMF1/FGE domain n=1 Tax=Methylomagnum ishizawai TaxID=1760988 RepID=A0A1Y6CZK6_9GAMM|nr:formylglycine-generating enzyme family protein [Methylomagnum ishizawai]SMF96118.1 Formylglycine-generating enzyme, required for sulfatase activity, contains SUMF1/FGE domain [Methylomagnum ishizawai]